MKFKKPIIIGSIIAGVATVASTAVIATQINHQNTESSPNIMMNRSRILNVIGNRTTNRHIMAYYAMETQNSHRFNQRYSKYNYIGQACEIRFYLKTKAPGSSTWTTVKEGFLYCIINGDDRVYEQDISWYLDRRINLENDFKIDVVFDRPRYRFSRNISRHDTDKYVINTGGSKTISDIRRRHILRNARNSWFRSTAWESTWRAFNHNHINHPTANTLINSSAFSQIIKPVTNNGVSFSEAVLQSIKFKMLFSGQNYFFPFGIANIEMYGNSKIKANFTAFLNK